ADDVVGSIDCLLEFLRSGEIVLEDGRGHGEERKRVEVLILDPRSWTLFKEHSSTLKGIKQGNVDTDIVFEAMKTLMERKDFSKILLVSGDGDYKKLVDYLVKRDVFKKLLFPNRQFASSLYNKLGSEFFDYLENSDIQSKISFTQKKRAP
ncbi:NYN domain-containing protein, partial [Candidatus Peregrinibacteria bacterium]|nr:NYN domain-containing protein [Candidatus Peregrinibacteria bacterium]MBI3817033.1 NYN domain-containing protein [Candidatus Peregrinibacteria bacterium]